VDLLAGFLQFVETLFEALDRLFAALAAFLEPFDVGAETDRDVILVGHGLHPLKILVGA
jgi:hypothetical protein